ncbi:MAG: hypothetical protein A2600_11840 [Candidatus Lambdaproteobacteria bacterium RIFOXYD1_FULL_56_27]|uniref:Fungal lipase-type domain-containing protein n=1 Tax=Candidatus Lambdaproteobacteria bacterium RIFOXYD2_FULL_56_26 TaxID=1817773 RepID=A0A1F6GXN1_9PROT|nr:MAG: hypothetical protein A2426_12175 [Candidatus Lambdaproteobacteria bacterium RIFOXYC1_FULL_56_13]OGH02790.1 MAG: hypothetical protein A2557_02955 [Candidatus Lambdaproteobacteria bacterium RIFOXYD2_FULL_56_26]OGH08033.1 MAG: hypothetical protein A2600_11840 [Candidatus Lambdaproteobacteria bacterium RIFOXYD1_FULL_56_27]
MIRSLNEYLLTVRKDQVILVTGHSLGGALAVLYGANGDRRLRPLIRSIYTYGQPRVGDGEFVSTLSQRFPIGYYRITNEEDPVPNLPKIGYEHGGTEIYYDGEGQVYCGRPKLGWFKKPFATGKGYVFFPGKFDRHQVAYYKQLQQKGQLIQAPAEPLQANKQCLSIIAEKQRG